MTYQAKQFPRLTEEQEQIEVFNWIKLNQAKWPELELVVGSAIGARMRPKTVTRMLRTGALKKGWPDIFVAFPRGPWNGLFIELKPMTRGIKRPRKPTASKDQARIMRLLAGQSYYVCLCRGHKAAIGIIEQYVKGEL